MSRRLTLASGATAILAFTGRGLAFRNRDGIVGPTPTPTPTRAAIPTNFALHAQIKAAAEPKITASAGGIGEEDTGACREANSLVNYCAQAIPNINSAPEEQIAQCLCCDADGDFEPEFFDGEASSCASWFKSAAPESTAAYSAWSTLGNVCGDMDKSVCSWSKAPATKTAATKTASSSSIPTITSGPADVVPDACDTLGTIGGYCLDETPGFGTLPPKSQATCLCYMSSEGSGAATWVPDMFDDAYSSCAGGTDTLTLDADFANICSSLGDFMVESASVSATAATTATASDHSSATAAASASSTTGSSETASGSATAVTVTVTPSAEPGTGAASGLSLPASWPVALGAAVMGAAILLL